MYDNNLAPRCVQFLGLHTERHANWGKHLSMIRQGSPPRLQCVFSQKRSRRGTKMTKITNYEKMHFYERTAACSLHCHSPRRVTRLLSPPAQSSAPLYFVYYLHAFITFATCATVIVAATLDQVLSKVSSSFHFALVLVCQLSRI